MSQLRRLRRQATFRPAPTAWPSRPTTLRDLLANLLSPEEFAQLANDGEPACDASHPPGLPEDTFCRFRKGHTCPCRFFGDLERD